MLLCCMLHVSGYYVVMLLGVMVASSKCALLFSSGLLFVVLLFVYVLVRVFCMVVYSEKLYILLEEVKRQWTMRR